MGKSAPASPDYKGAAEATGKSSAGNIAAQTAANRPNQSSGFASSQWTQGPDGQWTQSSQLQGGLGEAQRGLMGQGAALGEGMNWGQFGALGNGDAAREQAINATYRQSVSRLNPQWSQREQSMNASLANAGLDPNSQAARTAQSRFSQQRNDAYQGALNNAISSGNQAQALTFNQNLQARQQAISEALRARGQPLDEMRALMGLMGQAGFQGAGAADATNYLGAANAQGQHDMNAWQAENQANADLYAGLIKGAAGLAPLFFLSDERSKTNLRRLDVDALPGVPWAKWDYLPEFGGQPGFGVVAQDLQKVAPAFVHTHPTTGLLVVDYSFLRGGA